MAISKVEAEKSYNERVKRIKRSSRKFKIRFVLSLILILLLGFVFYILIGKGRIKYRQWKAQKAYQALLDSDEINWGEIYYDGTWDENRMEIETIPTECINSSIVYLDSNDIPILFMYSGTPYAASGNTRIVIYDEENETCRQIWGNWHSVNVEGYIPVDDDHEHALIFCRGAYQEVFHEAIYEFDNGELNLIGEVSDIFPYYSDLVTERFSNLSDEYYWRGTPVNITEYYTNRGTIINGYQDIEWENTRSDNDQ